MSRQCYLLSVFCLFNIIFINCSSKEKGNSLTKNNTIAIRDTVVIKDTIYISENASVTDDFYFSIGKISIGDYWEKKDDIDYNYYYRLLFTSVEERYYLYIEEIKVDDDSKVKLINRFKVNPQTFGQDYYNYPPEIVDWISPTIVKLLINKKEYNLDISKMEIVK